MARETSRLLCMCTDPIFEVGVIITVAINTLASAIILAENVMATSRYRVNSFSLDIGITTPLHWHAWELAL